MPSRGVEHRSNQQAQLASIHHGLATDPRIGDLLAACESQTPLTADPTSPEAVNIREIRRRYDRATKLPAELVEELAQVTSLAHHEWAEARKASDFDRFRPWLEKIVEVNPNFRVVTFSDQRLQCCNLSSLAPLSSALKQIDRESRRTPADHLGSIDEAAPSLDASLGPEPLATNRGSDASCMRINRVCLNLLHR